MHRPTTRTAAALTTAALALLAGACGPGAGESEADQPVVVDPGEEQGETLLPGTPDEVDQP